MCGIVGYVGKENAASILIDGLSKLEYRGYDSAGIAVLDDSQENKEIEVIKAKGRLQALREMTDNGRAVKGCCGIGHTRWATHGEPSVVNAHPHVSKDRKIARKSKNICRKRDMNFYLRQIQKSLHICWITITKEIPWKPSQKCWEG